MATHQIPCIEAKTRPELGTKPTAALRGAGRLPGVIYGHKQDPVHVSVDRGELTDLLHHRAHVIEVAIGAKKEPCLIKDVQWNHLGSELIHVDLTRVDLTERVTVEVDLELFGEAVGLKESGTILDHPLNEIEVECLANNIPEQIRVDVSALQVGESLTIGDLVLPEGVKATQPADTIVASVQTVAVEEEEEAVEAAAGEAEPEVIGKKEKEGEEEA